MEKTLKKEFKDKLISLGVYHKFMVNWGEQRKKNRNLPYSIKFLNKSLDFADLISGAFVWRRTKEGFDFWDNISNS